MAASPPASTPTTQPTSARSYRVRFWGVALPLLAVAIMVFSPVQSMALGQASAVHTPALPSTNGWTDIPGIVLPADLLLGAPLASGANVAGSLTFSETNAAGAASVAVAVNDPSSPEFQHYLQGDEFDQEFGPNAALQSGLTAYLSDHDISVSVVSPFLWNVRGTAAEMDAAFGTTFVSAQAPNGNVGWAPITPLRLPGTLASGVQATGAFQNAMPAAHPDNMVGKMTSERAQEIAHPLPRSPPAPHATLTLNVSNPFIVYPSANNGANESFDYVPTGLNESYTLTITGGSAPYTVQWWWGDGTLQTFVIGTSTLTVGHNFPIPGQTDYCDADFTWSCMNMTVTVTDGAADSGFFLLPLVPSTSPITDQLFYNTLPLYELGDSGQGVKIGLDEMCDESYSTTQYRLDFNAFSTAFGLPLATATTLQLIGSGDTNADCRNNGGGATGWAGETLLDMEWSHAIAPNATLIVDLSASTIQEGDAAWDTLSDGVFVDSNSWGCPYNDSASGCDYSAQPWDQAASQGQTFLTASGDCGAAGMLGSDPPTDTPAGLGVGGTDIYPYPSGIFRTEFAWNGSVLDPSGCENDEGSTGGFASNIGQDNASAIPAPWYQVGTPGFGANIWRGVPDVAAIGGTWVDQYMGIYGGWFPDAGTSLASPTWAGMLALIYDYNGTASKPNGLADNDLYQISKGADYGVGFHLITVGNNYVPGVPPNAGPCVTCYNETGGWSAVTGLGSPDVGNLAMLVAQLNGNPQAIGPLTVYLSTNVSYGDLGLNVNFGADVAGGSASLTGYSYYWEFGDGTSATTTVPYTSNAYACGGNLLATVTVSAPGVNPVISNAVHIHVSGGSACPFSATASATTNSLTAPLTASFTGSANGGTGPYAWSWSYGDGSPLSLAQDPVHTYNRSGTFVVNLTVTDSLSATAKSVLTLVVEAPLTATLTATPTDGTTPLAVDFTSTEAGGSGVYTYLWSLGDGATATTQDPTHTYTTAGTFPVVLTVHDGNALVAHAYTNITAETPLAATLTATPTHGAEVPLSVAFTSSATGGLAPYTYSWTFGDTGTSTLQDPSHSYATAGTFPVVLTVVDSSAPQALQAHAYTNISVEAPLAVAITATPGSGATSLTATYTSTVSGGNAPYSYAWSFGDGGTSTVSAPSHTYSGAGKFPVELTVTDSSTPTALVAHQFTNVTVYAPLTISITAGSTQVQTQQSTDYWAVAAGGAGSYTYSWAWGAGTPTSSGTENWTSYSFPNAGTFFVKVTVTDALGNTNTSDARIVTVSSPGGGSTTSGLGSGSSLYIILAVVVIAAVLVAVIALRRRKDKPPATMAAAPAGAAAAPWPPSSTPATAEPPPSSDAPPPPPPSPPA